MSLEFEPSLYKNCIVIGVGAELSTLDADGEIVFKSTNRCLRIDRSGYATINDKRIDLNPEVYLSIREAFESCRRSPTN